MPDFSTFILCRASIARRGLCPEAEEAIPARMLDGKMRLEQGRVIEAWMGPGMGCG